MLAISLSGRLLPPQIIYAGLTDRCHPTTVFPAGWDIYHSKSHWSTSDTLNRYPETVILPYFKETKSRLGLREEQKGICISNVFAAHRTPDFLELLRKNHIIPIFIPASCTSELQPLDLTVNQVFKTLMKEKFAVWYSNKIFQGLVTNQGGQVKKVNFTLSELKPLHAKWMIDVIQELGTCKHTIKDGFIKAGILIENATNWPMGPYDADTEPFVSDAESLPECSTDIVEQSFSVVVVTEKSVDQMVREALDDFLNRI